MPASCAPLTSALADTGAPPQAMIASELCQRRTPTGIALRGYVKNEAMVGRIDKEAQVTSLVTMADLEAFAKEIA